MHRTERLIVYSALIFCILLGLRAQFAAPAAAATSSARREPVTARIATCDVYDAVERLVTGDRYEPDRKREEERIRERLKPLEDELAAMETALKDADPKDEEAQAKARDYQKRRNDYGLLRGQAQQDYADFVARQYVEANDEVRTTAAAIAERLGYTHVIASRHKDKKITATDPERLVEAFLGRPVTVSPEDSDITDEVLADLKLG